MEPLIIASIAIATLIIGLLLGWLLAGRQAGKAAATAESLRMLLNDANEQLGAERARANEATSRVATLEAEQEAQRRALAEAKEALTAQFHEVGEKLLGSVEKQFFERADARFSKSEAQFNTLLEPVKKTLKDYQEDLKRIEQARERSYGELNRAVADLAKGNDIVRQETARLANVMRSSPKARGRWGEEQLRTILESAGLAENVDFSLQTAVSDGERQLRPDCVINLPGGRCIVVDVKCPLVHFEQAFDEDDEEFRGRLLEQHSNAMKSYANELGRKGYWRQFDLSPDFVIMFIPGEHFLSAAAERAPDLIETAYRNGVIIASTINMLALAKIMAGMWRQEALAAQANEVAEAGKELYRRLAAMSTHVTKLGRNLNLATSAYDDFVGSLESQVYTQAKRFEALNVDTSGRSIDPPPLVTGTTRRLTKLASGERGNDPA